jgi:hypothetical protein
MCNKEEGWSHILRCEETRSWRGKFVDKRFTCTEPEIGNRRVAINKDYDKLLKIRLYLSNTLTTLKNKAAKTDPFNRAVYTVSYKRESCTQPGVIT